MTGLKTLLVKFISKDISGLSPFFDYLSILVFSVSATLLLVYNFSVQVSLAPGDESPIAHAMYFAQQNEFVQDIYMRVWSPVALSSLMNWLPAILYKYFSISPYAFFILFTLLQNVLLSLASYSLAMTVTKRRPIALLSSIFILWCRPYENNLAMIAGLDGSPYANWLSLPCIIYALNLALKKQKLGSFAFLLVAALVHPVMGLLGTAIVSIHLGITESKKTFKKLLQLVCAFIGIGLAAYLPILISTRGLEYAPEQTLTTALLQNFHAVPWSMPAPVSYHLFINAIIWSVAAASLAARAKAVTKEAAVLLRIAIIFSLICCSLHFLGVFFRLSAIVNVIATRSTILLLTMCVPYLILLMWELSRTAQSIESFVCLTFLFRPGPLSLIALTFVALAHGQARNVVTQLSKILARLFGFVVSVLIVAEQIPFVGWLTTIFVIKPCLGAHLPYLLPQHLSKFMPYWLCLIILFVIFKAIQQMARLKHQSVAPLSKPMAKSFVSIVICSLAAFTLIESRALGKFEVGLARPYYDAQVWANKHTPPGSTFVLLSPNPSLSWRGVAHRPVVYACEVHTPYRSFKIGAEYNRKITDFFSRHHTYRRDKDMSAGHPYQIDLDEQGWVEFGKQFGADYLVRRTDWPLLSFPEAFRNSSIVVYAVRTHKPKTI